MNKFEIKSYQGAGDLRFGMTPEEVRATLKTEWRSFMKSPSSKIPTDAFRSHGIHVYYKTPGLCNAFEFFAPANPHLYGRKIMGEPASKAIGLIGEFDFSPKIELSGVTSILLGINLYIPDLDECREAPVKAVLVFEKGYFG